MAAAPGSELRRPSTSRTVAPGESASSIDDWPSASAYEAKRSTVTVISRCANAPAALGAPGQLVPVNPLRLGWFRILGVVLDVGERHVRDHRAQLLGRLEHRDGTRRHFNGCAGSRVPSHARLALPDLESAEAANLDVPLLLQRLLDCVEERVHHACAILLGDHWTGGPGNLFRDSLDQISFGH